MRTDSMLHSRGDFPGLQDVFTGAGSVYDSGADTTSVPLPPAGADPAAEAADPSVSPLLSAPQGHVNLSGAGGYAPVTLLDYLQGAKGTAIGEGGLYGDVTPGTGGMFGAAKSQNMSTDAFNHLAQNNNSDGRTPGMGAYVGGGYTTGMSGVDNYVYGNRGALAQPAPAPAPAPTPAAPPSTIPRPETGPMAPRDTSATQEDAQRYRGLQGSFGGY